MPLNYLEGNKDNIYAIDRLGDTFSNAVLGLAQNRARQQQFAQQMALERAQFELQQREAMLKEPLVKAQTDSYAADALRNKALASGAQGTRMAGEDLGFNLNQYAQAKQMGDPDITAMIAAQIAKNQGQLAATHPQNIGIQVPQIMASANDPKMQAMLATRTPMMERMTPGSTLYNVQSGGPEFTAPGGRPIAAPPLSYDDRLKLELAKVLAGRASEPHKPGERSADMSKVYQDTMGMFGSQGNQNPPAGRKMFSDGSGKKWIYKGTNPNPREDQNPAMWEESQ